MTERWTDERLDRFASATEAAIAGLNANVVELSARAKVDERMSRMERRFEANNAALSCE